MKDKKKVLVMDDDKIVRDVVAKVVEEYNAEAITARNGTEAREILEGSGHFDLLVVDLLMPELSGWDVLDILEKSPERAQMPTIILTGTRISSDEKRKLLQRVNAVVDKSSVTLDKLRAVLDSCCVL